MGMKELYAAAEKLEHFGEVTNLIMSADENAHFTVFGEKAAPPEEIESVFMASLESLLAYYSGPAEVLEWFKVQGVKW